MQNINKKFGKLTVIALDNERIEKEREEVRQGLRKRARKYYLCQCDCQGPVTSHRSDGLIGGRIQTCGNCLTEKEIEAHAEGMNTVLATMRSADYTRDVSNASYKAVSDALSSIDISNTTK